jgi:hypothetical protein
LLDRQVMIGAVQAIARQRGDVLVGRPHLGGTRTSTTAPVG